MADCYNLTQALALSPFPNARNLRPEHWSTFTLKKLIWYSNLFWVSCCVAAVAMLFCAYIITADYQARSFAAAERMKELQAEIGRLQDLNFYTAAQTITLAKNIQAIVDTAENGTQREFLKMVIPEAIKLQIKYHIPASATVSMAIYESRYGASDLAKNHFNFFGMKAFNSEWDGPRTFQNTYDLGQLTRAYFRSYTDAETGVAGYAQFLTSSDRYKPAFNYKRGDQFVQAVLAAGYCPDKDYYPHIKELMDRHHLANLDLPDIIAASPDTDTSKTSTAIAITKSKTAEGAVIH